MEDVVGQECGKSVDGVTGRDIIAGEDCEVESELRYDEDWKVEVMVEVECG